MATETNRGPEIARVQQGCESPAMLRIPVHLRLAHGADGGTVLDIHHGQIFRLNFVASRIVQMLKQCVGTRAIAEQLAHEFGIERARAEADVCEFVATLAKYDLVIEQNEI